MKPYYLVWNPVTGYTRFKHDTFAAAEKEAERLSLEHVEQPFIVLAPLVSFVKFRATRETFNYRDAKARQADDEIPF